MIKTHKIYRLRKTKKKDTEFYTFPKKFSEYYDSVHEDSSKRDILITERDKLLNDIKVIELGSIEVRDNFPIYQKTLEQLSSLKKKLHEIDQKMLDIDTNSREVEYCLTSNRYLFLYHDITHSIQEKSEIDDLIHNHSKDDLSHYPQERSYEESYEQDSMKETPRTKDSSQGLPWVIDDDIHSDSSDDEDDDASFYHTNLKMTKSHDLIDFMERDDTGEMTNSKIDVLIDFQREIEPGKYHSVEQYRKAKNTSLCSDCKIEMTHRLDKGMLECPKCGVFRFLTITDIIPEGNNSSSYERSEQFSYKKVNHFKDELSIWLGKITITFPKEHYDTLKNHFRQNNIKMKDLTTDRTIEAMKECNIPNTFYKCGTCVTCHLADDPLPYVSQEVIDTFITMFKKILIPYEKYKGTRVSLISCRFITLKIIMNDGRYTHYLKYLRRVKSPNVRKELEGIWVKIRSEGIWDD
jgi:hypothetical protein